MQTDRIIINDIISWFFFLSTVQLANTNRTRPLVSGRRCLRFQNMSFDFFRQSIVLNSMSDWNILKTVWVVDAVRWRKLTFDRNTKPSSAIFCPLFLKYKRAHDYSKFIGFRGRDGTILVCVLSLLNFDKISGLHNINRCNSLIPMQMITYIRYMEREYRRIDIWLSYVKIDNHYDSVKKLKKKNTKLT